MSTASTRPAVHGEIPLPASVPRLETGDQLSRDEFERRYHAMPDVKKAELIEGIVYMPSPVRYDQHGLPHAQLMGLLTAYYFQTPGVLCCDNSTVRLDMINEPQPDGVLLIEPDRGGTVKLVDGYIEGAPELVAEISASTVSLDLNAKLRAYHRNQVREYVVCEGRCDRLVRVARERIRPLAGRCRRSAEKQSLPGPVAGRARSPERRTGVVRRLHAGRTGGRKSSAIRGVAVARIATASCRALPPGRRCGNCSPIRCRTKPELWRASLYRREPESSH